MSSAQNASVSAAAALPLVSVSIITYNHGAFIGPALDSVLAQDYPNVEIVVADDGSSDGTAEVIDEYVRRYPERIVALPRRENQGIDGIVENANRALRPCRGKYIVFLQGDDLFLPGKIRQQVEWMETDSDRVLCGHDVETFDSESGATLGYASTFAPLSEGRGARSLVLFGVPFHTVAIMVRRSALPEHGWDARLRVSLDWKLWIDTLSGGGSYGFIPGVLARYRRHRGNATATFQAICLADRFGTVTLVEEEHPELAEACRRSRSRIHYAAGIEALSAGDVRAARRSFRMSLRTRPGAKALRAFVATLLPHPLVERLVARRIRSRMPLIHPS